MLAIRDPNKVPHGGAFVWKCSQCEATFRHHTVPLIFEKARQHCEANGHEFSNNSFTQSVRDNTPDPEVCHEVEDNGFPAFSERVVSAAKATMRHARNGFKGTEEELKTLRFTICSSCVYYGGESGGTWFGIVCKKCGCSGVKLKWKAETCPLGLW